MAAAAASIDVSPAGAPHPLVGGEARTNSQRSAARAADRLVGCYGFPMNLSPVDPISALPSLPDTRTSVNHADDLFG